MSSYRRNHFVPQWYQKRFICNSKKEKKYYFLDLKPPEIERNGRTFKKKELNFWGPIRCFVQKDLYTTQFGSWASTEIEKKFFGKVDIYGKKAVEYFSDFKHPSASQKHFRSMLLYMSLQKLRTPKGLKWLQEMTRCEDKNLILHELQKLKNLHCAIWSECVWQIADAKSSDTKFIVSDHPVTVYNKGCFPRSRYCLDYHDPEIWKTGTHTIFPLSSEKILILTNLSWVRNPYTSPLINRPNPNPFRDSFFSFLDIQTQRYLSEAEVIEINYIIKMRAFQYIAAQEKEWLYPEDWIEKRNWEKLGRGFLLMPDPRSMSFSSSVLLQFENGRVDGFDAYGRKPWDKNYDDKELHDKEWKTSLRFQGDFAKMFGPKRRGLTYHADRLDNAEDSPEYHKYHLSLATKANKRKK